jgi:tRNA A-37 threonylcarbamoyl transferase component Bud32
MTRVRTGLLPGLLAIGPCGGGDKPDGVASLGGALEGDDQRFANQDTVQAERQVVGPVPGRRHLGVQVRTRHLGSGGGRPARRRRRLVQPHQSGAPAAVTTTRTGPTAPLSTTLSLPGPVAGDPRIPPAGRVVAGRYRLRRLLGRGGMGAVWLAEDVVLHRRVAVKQLLLSGLATDVERRAARARLRREARLAARVDHSGTVRVYDLAEEAGDPWIVMEALPGRTLQAALRDRGPLPVGQVTRLGLCLLEALAATHRAGVVHRDVNPGNVQLCGGPRVVLTDFGVASTSEGGASASTGEIVGSPGYMAPEQVHGEAVEPACDLFSLGATLYAAVEGRSPFGKGCTAATLAAVVTDPPAPLRHAGPIGPVIQGLLAKDPARRLGPDQARAALQAITGNHFATVSRQRGGR